MASVVDICNLALGRLGDDAAVSSIDPPDGSSQAQHCVMFYPLARDSLLEMHPWGFATVRATLAPVTNVWPEWDYAYAQPSDAINLLAVLPSDATDDYSVGVPESAGGRYVPQAFASEIDANGTQVILTDQVNAALRYSRIVEDTTLFSPLFVDALGWLLASYLAGPVIKGTSGVQMSQAMLKAFQAVMSKAMVSDANQRRESPTHSVSWLAWR